jgi:hypothetical protein
MDLHALYKKIYGKNNLLKHLVNLILLSIGNMLMKMNIAIKIDQIGVVQFKYIAN